MIRAGVVRFPRVVLPPALWVRVSFLCAVGVGASTLMLDPGGGHVDSALATVVLLQMFAVSNGFAAAAARGNFDPILVSGHSRAAIGVGAAVAAALPGAVAWATICLLALLLGEPLTAVAAPHRQAAFLVVSGIGWAAGIALPRLAAGALWSAVLLALLLSRTLFATHLAAIQQPPSSLQDVAIAAAACVVCPFVLLSDFAGVTDARVVSVTLAVTALAVSAGIAFVVRHDYPLTETA